MKLAIIDTKCANLASLKFALDRLGFCASISSEKNELEKADKLFLPGVGTAGKAMANLAILGLCDFVRETKKPLLGICLGMQILGEFSSELNQKTLGVMPFRVREFKERAGFTLPHMGWNDIKISRQNALFAGLNGAYFYFVHSFCVALNEFTLAKCEYSEPFSAALMKENFFGVQFHPERSGEAGAVLLKNFVKM